MSEPLPAPPPPTRPPLRDAAGTADRPGAAHHLPARHFPCSQCGAELEFSIGAQALKCPYCGHEQALVIPQGKQVQERDLAAALQREAERRRGRASGNARGAAPGGAGDTRKEVSCEACGATVAFEGTLTATRCSYCGGPITREKVHDAPDRIPVDGLLPFAVEQEAAHAALRSWVTGRWFAPNDFLRQGVEGRFDGVYLPYFTFDAMTATSYRGERGDHYWVEVGSGNQKRREVRTRWTPAWGDFQRFFDDVLVAAVQALPQPLLRGLEPWPLARCIPFTPEALAGARAHTYDLELEACLGVGRQRIEEAIREDVRERIGGDEQRIEDVQTSWAGLTYKHLLLPTWLLAYRWKEKSYRVVVNAVTGEVSGERPWSAVKIGLAVVAALVAAGIAWVASQSGQ